MSSLVVLAWKRYVQQLHQHPLRTKALTAACVAGLSDALAQYISTQSWNVLRTIKLAVFGLLWSGPSGHFWQQFLEKVFRYKKTTLVVISKMIVEQVTYGPLFNILFTSWFTCVVEGRRLQDLLLKLRNVFPGVQLQAWKVWPLANLVNYMFVPLHLRILFVNIVALFWSLHFNLSLRRAKQA